MKSILFAAAAAVALTSSAAQAEIICTERGGCWETGKKFASQQSLPGSRYYGLIQRESKRSSGLYKVQIPERYASSGPVIVQRSRHGALAPRTHVELQHDVEIVGRWQRKTNVWRG